MPRTCKPKPTDGPETILDQFAGPARPMSQAEVDVITRRFKKALVERMLGGELVIPFFAFPPAIRRVLYTSNALESVHARLRKIIKTRGHFPNDEAATKLIWLALRNITAGWWKAANYSHLAMNQSRVPVR